MKIYILLLISSISLASIASEDQNNFGIKIENSATGELVIGIPNFNMKRYDDFIKTVTSVNGISNIEYCSTVGVFLINYDISVFNSVEEAFRALENEVKGYKLFHKLGASHAELKKDC